MESEELKIICRIEESLQKTTVQLTELSIQFKNLELYMISLSNDYSSIRLKSKQMLELYDLLDYRVQCLEDK